MSRFKRRVSLKDKINHTSRMIDKQVANVMAHKTYGAPHKLGSTVANDYLLWAEAHREINRALHRVVSGACNGIRRRTDSSLLDYSNG